MQVTIGRVELQAENPAKMNTAQIHTGKSGLSLAAQEQMAKIRIPTIVSPDHLHEVFRDLQEVADQYANNHDWFVNISDLDAFPVSLAGALFAYQRDLEKKSHTLVLEVEDLFHFRAALVAKLRKYFKLRKPQSPISSEKKMWSRP